MGVLFDFKCTCDSTLVYICQADAEKCIFVWTILSQTPRRTPQVTSDAGRISARIFWLFPKERRMLRKRDYQGRLSFHFFDRWMTDLATHRQKKVQAMSWKNLQMLEFCLFTWSWMGPINCAPNPVGERFLLFYVWCMRAWKLCVQTEKALARPCFCAGSSDPLLLALINTSDPYNTAWLASFYIRSYMDGHQWKFSWRTTNFSGVQHVLA